MTTGNPDPNWKPVDPAAEDPKYAKLTLSDPIQMSYCQDFRSDMRFLAGMEQLMEQYRNFNVHDHPAIQKMIEEKSKVDAEAMADDDFDIRDEL